jgi:hypothetical protein
MIGGVPPLASVRFLIRASRLWPDFVAWSMSFRSSRSVMDLSGVCTRPFYRAFRASGRCLRNSASS